MVEHVRRVDPNPGPVSANDVSRGRPLDGPRRCRCRRAAGDSDGGIEPDDIAPQILRLGPGQKTGLLLPLDFLPRQELSANSKLPPSTSRRPCSVFRLSFATARLQSSRAATHVLVIVAELAHPLPRLYGPSTCSLRRRRWRRRPVPRATTGRAPRVENDDRAAGSRGHESGGGAARRSVVRRADRPGEHSSDGGKERSLSQPPRRMKQKKRERI